MSATNPENGTVTYTYNSDGTLATKTDAKSQRAIYTYDAYKRVTMVQRGTVSGGTFTEDKTQRTTPIWDVNTLNQAFSQNSMGRLAAVQYSGTNGTDTYADMYSYTAAGEIADKRFQVTRSAPYPWQPMTANLDATYTYDNEGRTTATSYPLAGPSFATSYDAMGRAYTLTETGPGTPGVVVSQTTYGPANETLSMTALGIYDSWSYNSMLQVTQTTQGWLNTVYGYSATQNNGKAIQAQDLIAGETVNYTYDSLNRLASAAATNGAWGDAYVYDGFGNLLQKNVTAGSAPSLAQAVNVGNNQIVGYSYDGNGNQTSVNVPGAGSVPLQYDLANRVTSIGANLGNYAYNAGNQRVWRKATVSGQSVEQVFFYGADGKVMGTYGLTETVYGNQQPVLNLAVGVQSLYFAGRLIGRSNWLYTNSFQPISSDPVGTVRWDAAVAPNGVTEAFWPWGEERGTVTGNDRAKFATYWRDSESSLDYGVNRYYSNVTGRFLEADPYGGSGSAGNPQSWNRYAYVEGDPVNGNDPSGQFEFAPGFYSGSADNWWVGSMGPLFPIWVGFWGGGGGGGKQGPCPSAPVAPGLPNDELQNNIKAARAESFTLFGIAQGQNPTNPAAADAEWASLLGAWLYTQFRVGGPWDFKDQPGAPRTGPAHQELVDFGNFNFGVVLTSLGFPQYLTLNVAGVYQVFGIGKNTEGIPFVLPPFGDSRHDQGEITQGIMYLRAVKNGCK